MDGEGLEGKDFRVDVVTWGLKEPGTLQWCQWAGEVFKDQK